MGIEISSSYFNFSTTSQVHNILNVGRDCGLWIQSNNDGLDDN